MTYQNELGKAILQGEEPVDIPALTQRVLRTDRRRMWMLGMVCVGAWILVVAIPWAIYMPMTAKLAELQTEINRGAGPGVVKDAQIVAMLDVVRQGTVSTFIVSLFTMLAAAISTVAFIFLTRRATLRQINARLSEISAQLRALQPPTIKS